MQIKQVSFELSRTINLGNYSNVKPTIGVVIELNTNDSPTEVMGYCRKFVEDEMIEVCEQYEVKEIK